MKSFCVMWKIYFDTLVLCIIVILGNFKTDRKFSQKSIRSDTFRKTKLIFPWQLFIFNFIYFSEKHTFAYYFQIRSKIGIKLKPFFIIFFAAPAISCDKLWPPIYIRIRIYRLVFMNGNLFSSQNEIVNIIFLKTHTKRERGKNCI